MSRLRSHLKKESGFFTAMLRLSFLCIPQWIFQFIFIFLYYRKTFHLMIGSKLNHFQLIMLWFLLKTLWLIWHRHIGLLGTELDGAICHLITLVIVEWKKVNYVNIFFKVLLKRIVISQCIIINSLNFLYFCFSLTFVTLKETNIHEKDAERFFGLTKKPIKNK